MKTPDGMVYEGDFEEGLPHGKVNYYCNQVPVGSFGVYNDLMYRHDAVI